MVGSNALEVQYSLALKRERKRGVIMIGGLHILLGYNFLGLNHPKWNGVGWMNDKDTMGSINYLMLIDG